MKRDDKQALLALSTAELNQKLRELEAQLVKARQERHLQDKSEVDIKRAYKLRKQIKMIKAETHRRELVQEVK